MREGIALPDHRRRPVLRAQGNQGHAGLHAARHQPARRREPAAGDQRADARHRQGRDGRARAAAPVGLGLSARPRAAPPHSLWSRLVGGLDRGAFTGRAAASLRVFRDLIVGLIDIARQEPVSIAIGKVLDRSGYLPLFARTAPRRRRAGSRTWRNWCRRRGNTSCASPGRRSADSSTACRCCRTWTRRGRGGRPHLDDDAAQRQGPRVPRRVHRRPRGRAVPALAVGRGRRGARGGAPALLRRHDAGAKEAVPRERQPPAVSSASIGRRRRRGSSTRFPTNCSSGNSRPGRHPTSRPCGEGRAPGQRRLRRRRGETRRRGIRILPRVFDAALHEEAGPRARGAARLRVRGRRPVATSRPPGGRRQGPPRPVRRRNGDQRRTDGWAT